MATKDRPYAQSVHKFVNQEPDQGANSSVSDQQDKAANSQSDVSVRSYRLGESAAIQKFPIRYELNNPDSTLDQPQTWRLFTRRLFAGVNSSKPLYVAEDSNSGERLGALQCKQRGADGRWSLRYMNTAYPVDEDPSVAIELLEYAISQAGSCGARRIMARSTVDSPITGALRSVGFTAFGHESVYSLPAVPPGVSNPNVRTQEKSDGWAIHQLYLQTTPTEVQYAEALTSHEWDQDLEGRTRRGWLVADKFGLSAYIRVRAYRNLYRADVMFRPESHEVLPMLLNAMFAVLQSESDRPIYIAVRRYQQELSSVLEVAGFEFQTEQYTLVRYTTASVPMRVSENFELLRTAEADARRVPSFYVRDVHE